MTRHNASTSPSRFTIERCDTGAMLTLLFAPGATVEIDLSHEEVDELRALLTSSVPTTAAPSASPKPAPPAADLTATSTPEEPVFTSTSGENAGTLPAVPSPQQLQIIDGALPYLDRLGLTREDLHATLDRPDDEWVDHTGRRAVVLRGDHAIVLGLTDQVVLSILPAARALATKPRPAPPIPHYSGGSGTRYPTSMRELHNLLRARGVRLELTPGGHYQAEYEGRRYNMPYTPSDHKSLPNTIKGLERALHIDLRRDAAAR